MAEDLSDNLDLSFSKVRQCGLSYIPQCTFRALLEEVEWKGRQEINKVNMSLLGGQKLSGIG